MRKGFKMKQDIQKEQFDKSVLFGILNCNIVVNSAYNLQTKTRLLRLRLDCLAGGLVKRRKMRFLAPCWTSSKEKPGERRKDPIFGLL